MIDEFSSFARMPAPVFRDENVGELAKQALFLQQVANPGIEYQTELPPDPVMLRCDPRQLSQVLTNLLLNAAQAIAARTAGGESLPKGFISLRIERIDDEVVLTVTDNGRGLPDSDRNRLMEPYVTTKVKGTGLGLAIVAKVMDDHGGTITLADRSGGGAIVMLRFPVREAEAEPQSTESQMPEKVRAYGA